MASRIQGITVEIGGDTTKLQNALKGVDVYKRQGYKDMSPPTKELMKLTLEERIAHGGHKVLRWMMDNVFVRQDPAGNIKMDKEKSTEKIDGAVATLSLIHI